MAARFSFRWLIAGISALGLVSVGASGAFAQSTWTGSGANANWTTSGNWTGGVPGTNGTVTLPGTPTGAKYTITLPGSPGTASISSLTAAAGTTPYQLNTGILNLVDGGSIINSRRNGATPGLQVNGTLNLAGSTATVGGATGFSRLNSVTASASGAVLTLTSGSTQINTTTGDVGLRVANGATLVSNGSTLGGDVTVQSGGVLKTVGLVSGAYLSTNLSNNLTLNGGSTTQAFVGDTAGQFVSDNFVSGGTTSYGGDLLLNLSNIPAGTLYDSWSTTNIFDGTTTGSFSSVTLAAGAPSPYAGLTFTASGGAGRGEWVSGTFAGMNGETQWLVFQQGTGNLVVVPEPSTIVFAGVGVAMAGWSAWKKRRLAKVLAKK